LSKKAQDLPKKRKKCAIFTKKYEKIPIFHHFFDANQSQTYPNATNRNPLTLTFSKSKPVPNLPLSANPKAAASTRNIFTEKACFKLPKSLQLAALYSLKSGNEPDSNRKTRFFIQKPTI
jgi:hypothetical protein